MWFVLIAAYFLGQCTSNNSGNDGSAVGSLEFRRATVADLTPLGGGSAITVPSDVTIYRGVYRAPDGAPVEAYLSLRELNVGQPSQGIVKRLGLEVQGGTGGEIIHFLSGDGLRHRAWLAVNYRGSGRDELASPQNPSVECTPGPSFISCLKSRSSFRLISPRRNAGDVNEIVGILRNRASKIVVDGATMTPQQLLPSDVMTDAIDLYTGSFGGVILGYMLARQDMFPLHNVFLEQVTGPTEYVISGGFELAQNFMNILLTACKDDSVCRGMYPNIRINFYNFMVAYRDNPIQIDGDMIYAGGIFDRLMGIVEDEESVGKAIRYIGELANAHAASQTTITLPNSAMPTTGSRQSFPDVPSASYGIPGLSSNDIAPILPTNMSGQSFFPGITNRTAYICSFAFNRTNQPDSSARYDSELMRPANLGNAYGYGFLLAYRTFASICPQLAEVLDKPTAPSINRRIAANKVILFIGGLDVKHEERASRELADYFKERQIIRQKYLGQRLGQDSDCIENIAHQFWITPNDLGDDCEASNTFTASQLSGW